MQGLYLGCLSVITFVIAKTSGVVSPLPEKCFTHLHGYNSAGGAQVAEHFAIDTVSECLILCLLWPQCQAVDFNYHFKLCYVHDKVKRPHRHHMKVDHFIKTANIWKLAQCMNPVEIKILKEKPAFSGRLSQTVALTHGVNQTLVFDRLDLNQAEAYDTKTGIFTAPLGGAYSFTLDLVSVPGSLASATILHNTDMLHTVWANGQYTGDLGVASGTILCSLQPQDQVSVVLFRHMGNVYVDDSLTRFSGHML